MNRSEITSDLDHCKLKRATLALGANDGLPKVHNSRESGKLVPNGKKHTNDRSHALVSQLGSQTSEFRAFSGTLVSGAAADRVGYRKTEAGFIFSDTGFRIRTTQPAINL